MSDEPAEVQADAPVQAAVLRAFGEENRARLLGRYFQRQPTVTAADAWRHIYRLLLWTDKTTALAHCYESDKCQPGRPWYARSLAFHGWVAEQLGTTPAELSEQIDWLFNHAVIGLAAATYSARVRHQRAPYEGQGFPEPGEDPELAAIVGEELRPWMPLEPPADALQRMSRRIRAYIGQENKRKNLVGEGFEDCLAEILRRIPEVANAYEIMTRPWLHVLPGFNPLASNAKPRQVDFALIRRADGHRTLVTVKWSIRADREEQFNSDFNDYVKAEAAGESFDYVLVTNEFDAARLTKACDRRYQISLLFSDVVHVNPAGPAVAYGEAVKGRTNAAEMARHIRSGRLTSLEAWITKLAVSA